MARGGWGLYVTRNRPWFQLANQETTLGNASGYPRKYTDVYLVSPMIDLRQTPLPTVPVLKAVE